MQLIVMLLDMDYFFAQVEERENPLLAGKPLMVCIFSGRGELGGVVSTCNYAARALGVHSGMPIAFAKKKAPEGAFLKADFEKYNKASEAVMGIVGAHAKTVEQASIDEAYADITQECNGDFKKAAKIAQEIKKEILKQEKLTCSVGIGENKLIAKMAAGEKKPDGLTVVKQGEAAAFLGPMPVGKLFGVGKKTEEKLHALGIKTIGELAKKEEGLLKENFGNSFGHYLFEASKGVDEEEVREREEPAQVSKVASFPEDTNNREEIAKMVATLAQGVHEKLCEGGLEFRQVTFIGILEGLQTHTKSKTQEKHSQSGELLKSVAQELAAGFGLGGKKMRRAGVRVGMLQKKQEGVEEEGGKKKGKVAQGEAKKQAQKKKAQGNARETKAKTQKGADAAGGQKSLSDF